MFDIREPGSAPGSTITVPDTPIPLERLEAQICELAGHLTAATCRFLVLLADFDARRGWASWEMNSCAQWLSWKCQMSAGVSAETIIPPWYGERLDLDHAIYTCLANARSPQERREQAHDPARGRVQVFEPDGWADRIRQYYDQHTAA